MKRSVWTTMRFKNTIFGDDGMIKMHALVVMDAEVPYIEHAAGIRNILLQAAIVSVLNRNYIVNTDIYF